MRLWRCRKLEQQQARQQASSDRMPLTVPLSLRPEKKEAAMGVDPAFLSNCAHALEAGLAPKLVYR
jgi:hypothetical protein